MKREFSALSPNNALLETVIREACENGVKIFDFGASGPLDSVRKFKESFGAGAVEFPIWSRQSARYEWTQKARKKFEARARRGEGILTIKVSART